MKLLKIILKLLSKNEKKRGVFVLIMVTIMALLDAAGVISIIPFLAILGNPQMVEQNEGLKQLYLVSKSLGVSSINDFLIFLGISALLLIIFSSLFRILTHHVLNHFIEMRRHSISEKLLKNYLSLEYSSFLNRHSGELSKTILSEVDQFVGQILRPVTNMLVYFIVLIVLVSLLLFVNPFLTIIICCVFGVLYGVFFLLLRNFFVRIGTNRVKANKDRFIIISELFNSIKYIKLSGKEEIYFSQFQTPSSLFSRMQANFQTFIQVPKFIVEGVGFGSVLVLTIFLMRKYGGIENGALGEILPVLGLYTFTAYRLLPATTNIYQGLSSLNYGSASIQELYENSILDKRITSINKKPILFKKRIFLKNISYFFSQSNKLALKNITLEIPFGTSLGIIGKTGSGKTTLVDIILGLLEPSKGTLHVDEKTITKINRKSWQKILGYVPQEIILSHCSLIENIAFGIPKNEIDIEKVFNCAKIAHIHDFISSELPEKYETLVGERGTRLSGGQRQRIGIARALYNEPEVLILDEATSALDSKTELKVINAIEELYNKKTIIIITHRMTAIKNCENIIQLENGTIKN